MDNSSVHVNPTSRKFMSDSGIKCVSIPPYCPQLNAAEKAIAAIKSNLKKCWIGGRTPNLNIVKQTIDGLTEES